MIKRRITSFILKQYNRSVRQSRIIILTPIVVRLKVKTKKSRSVIETLLMLLHLPSSAPPMLFKRQMEDRWEAVSTVGVLLKLRMKSTVILKSCEIYWSAPICWTWCQPQKKSTMKTIDNNRWRRVNLVSQSKSKKEIWLVYNKTVCLGLLKRLRILNSVKRKKSFVNRLPPKSRVKKFDSENGNSR